MRSRKKTKDIPEKQKVFESSEYQKFLKENATEMNNLESIHSKSLKKSKKNENTRKAKESMVPENSKDILVDNSDFKFKNSIDSSILPVSETPATNKKSVTKKIKKSSEKVLEAQDANQNNSPNLENISKEHAKDKNLDKNFLNSEDVLASNINQDETNTQLNSKIINKTSELPKNKKLGKKSKNVRTNSITITKKADEIPTDDKLEKISKDQNFEQNLPIESENANYVDENTPVSLKNSQDEFENMEKFIYSPNNLDISVSKDKFNKKFLKLKIQLPLNLKKEIKKSEANTVDSENNVKDSRIYQDLSKSTPANNQISETNEILNENKARTVDFTQEIANVDIEIKPNQIDSTLPTNSSSDLKNNDSTANINNINSIYNVQNTSDLQDSINNDVDELPHSDLSFVHKNYDGDHIAFPPENTQSEIKNSDFHILENESGFDNLNQNYSDLTIIKNTIPEPITVNDNLVNIDSKRENLTDSMTVENIIPETFVTNENTITIDSTDKSNFLENNDRNEEISKFSPTFDDYIDTEITNLEEFSISIFTNDKELTGKEKLIDNDENNTSDTSDTSNFIATPSNIEDKNSSSESELSCESTISDVIQSYYSESFFSHNLDSLSESDTSLSFGSYKSDDSDDNTSFGMDLELSNSNLTPSEQDNSSSSLEFPHYETKEIVNWQQILPIMNYLSQKTEFFELKDLLKPLKEEILKKEPVKSKKISEANNAYLDSRYLYFLKKVCFLGKNDAMYYCKDQAKFLTDRANKNKANLMPSKAYYAVDSSNDVKIYVSEENKKNKKQTNPCNYSESEGNYISLQRLHQINDVKIPDYNKETFEYLVFKHGENMDSISKEAHMSIKDVILIYYLKYHNVTLEITGTLLDKYVEEEWSMHDRILFEENFMKYNTKFHKYMINKSEDDLRIYYRFYLKNYIPINWTDEERTLFAHLFGAYKKDWVSMEKCFQNKTAQDLKVFYCSYFKKLDEEERNREAKLVEMDLPPIIQKKRGRKPNALRLLGNETEDRDE